MKENGEIQSLTLYYFVLHWSRQVCEHKNLPALLQGFAEQVTKLSTIEFEG